MNQAEKDQLRIKIKENLGKLEKDIEALVELTKPISPENAIGRVSRMDAINNKSVNEAALRLSKMKQAKLHHAISRIDTSGFGICTRCKNPIAPARLMYMPESSKCVNCAD